MAAGGEVRSPEVPDNTSHGTRATAHDVLPAGPSRVVQRRTGGRAARRGFEMSSWIRLVTRHLVNDAVDGFTGPLSRVVAPGFRAKARSRRVRGRVFHPDRQRNASPSRWPDGRRSCEDGCLQRTRTRSVSSSASSRRRGETRRCRAVLTTTTTLTAEVGQPRPQPSPNSSPLAMTPAQLRCDAPPRGVRQHTP